MAASTRDKNKRTREYKNRLAKLPGRIVKLAEAQFHLFLEDDHHPSLSNHLIEDNRQGRHRPCSHAVSITMRYRALYVVDNGVNVWYWIGTHEEYNNYIGLK